MALDFYNSGTFTLSIKRSIKYSKDDGRGTRVYSIVDGDTDVLRGEKRVTYMDVSWLDDKVRVTILPDSMRDISSESKRRDVMMRLRRILSTLNIDMASIMGIKFGCVLMRYDSYHVDELYQKGEPIRSSSIWTNGVTLSPELSRRPNAAQALSEVMAKWVIRDKAEISFSLSACFKLWAHPFIVVCNDDETLIEVMAGTKPERRAIVIKFMDNADDGLLTVLPDIKKYKLSSDDWQLLRVTITYVFRNIGGCNFRDRGRTVFISGKHMDLDDTSSVPIFRDARLVRNLIEYSGSSPSAAAAEVYPATPATPVTPVTPVIPVTPVTPEYEPEVEVSPSYAKVLTLSSQPSKVQEHNAYAPDSWEELASTSTPVLPKVEVLQGVDVVPGVQTYKTIPASCRTAVMRILGDPECMARIFIQNKARGLSGGILAGIESDLAKHADDISMIGALKMCIVNAESDYADDIIGKLPERIKPLAAAFAYGVENLFEKSPGQVNASDYNDVIDRVMTDLGMTSE